MNRIIKINNSQKRIKPPNRTLRRIIRSLKTPKNVILKGWEIKRRHIQMKFTNDTDSEEAILIYREYLETIGNIITSTLVIK
jgi:hypothetical protein